ncbi:MAG: hypothetical protein ISQ13_02685 [Candidatus Margulisbacteria bacterium]|nr:hypothetical protein [Candidatus Margulisiibacteriota bacterium]
MDHFHPIRSIFCQIDLFDECTLKKSSLPSHSVTFLNQDISKKNTCTKVFESMAPYSKTMWDLSIKKHIPLGSGLGGGSSNAAALMRSLNAIEGLNLDPGAMNKMAFSVGSDTPYFLTGGFCDVSGRGDVVHALTNQPPLCFVLLMPRIECSSKSVYECLDTRGKFDDLNSIKSHEMMPIGYNRLAEPAFHLHPDLLLLKQKAGAISSKPVYLSGSGSTLYIVANTTKEQEEIYQQLSGASLPCNVLKCRSIDGTEGRT